MTEYKLRARFNCNKCGFLFPKPKIKITHDGITTHHIECCPRCKSEDIKDLEV